MTDVTTSMRLEVETASSNVFVWGVSTWSGYHWAGPGDNAGTGVEWLNILGETHDIKVKRGAKRDGLTVSLEAGMLQATVYDSDVDPNTNPYIKPGTPIRLIHAARNNVVANPSAGLDVSGWLKTSGRTLVKDDTTGYIGNTSFKFTSTSAATVNEWAYTENYAAAEGQVWTGSVWVKGTGSMVLRVTWRDASLAATVGGETAVIPLTGSWQRVSITSSAAPAGTAWVFLRLIQKTDGTQDMWFDGAMLEQSATLNDYTSLKGDTAVFTGVLTNVAVTYRKKKPQVMLSAVDKVKDLANISRSGVVAGYLSDRVADLLGKHGIPYVMTGGTEYLARNAYDSSLLNHLTLATTSAQGEFFVSKENVVKAYGKNSLPSGPVTLNFTDQQAVTPTDVEYTDIAVRYDSASMVNEIYVNNLTYAEDAEFNPISVETKYGPYRNVTSIATYGAYTEEVATNFDTTYTNWAEVFANEMLAKTDQPELRVDSVRFSAGDNRDVAAALEIFDLVNVDYSNESFHIGQDFRVLALEHTITAGQKTHKWLVDVDLINLEGGI